MSHEHLLSPYRIGPMALKNRVMLPPHGHVVSSLWGTVEMARGHIDYWRARTDAAWVDGVSAHVRNTMVPGFEPTGVGAQSDGHFRQPYFLDRVGRLAEVLHADDTRLTVQMILQGGMPHGASPVPSGPVVTQVPHPLTREEIDWFVEEYRHGAEQVALAGADGVELHLNHDDMMEYFLSPLTNRRQDEYGGPLDGRLRFPLRVLAALRKAMGPDRVVGVRLTMAEAEPGGYDLDGGIEIAQALEASGLVDYLSLAMGSPWGNPSYIQSHHHRPAEWAPLAGKVRSAVGLPIAYTGRVTSPDVAEEVLAAGHADVVGMARAWIADPDLLSKARTGRSSDIRPCVGGNECINRRLLESNVTFSCAVNPAAGREGVVLPSIGQRRRVLVVGGGPAGMEVAAICAERGHDVTLWEATDRLGGQLRTATAAPRYDDYADYLAWQARRLAAAGVAVALSHPADASAVIAFGADEVVVATGGRPRRPDLPGGDLPRVHLAADVLAAPPGDLGERVVVAAHDEHLPPLAVADFLAQRGHRVTLVHGAASPAPLVSRYLLGSALGRLDAGDVELRGSESVVAVVRGGVRVRNVYSEVVRTLEADAVVLAYGAVPDSSLHNELHERGVTAHLLGDAFAPRRLVFAVRQAHDLAITL